MNKTQRDELRKLAKAATPGEWHSIGGIVSNKKVCVCTTLVSNDETCILDCRYIAAANPATILALLDRMDKLEKVAGAAKKAHSLIVDIWPEPVDYEDIEYLRAALSALGEVQDDDA